MRIDLLALLLVLIAVATLIRGTRRLARALAGPLGLAPLGPGALAGAAGLALFLVSTALFGRLFERFDAGLAAAALAGIALDFGTRRWAPDPLPAPRHAGGPGWTFCVAVAATTALYAFIAFRYQMHDEHAIFGHKSMVEELRRGVYPIYPPPFPGHEARYHVGFDLIAGTIARASGASSDLAIDLTTIGLVFLISWCAGALAMDAAAERSAGMAVLAVHLGAGLAAFMLAGHPGRHPRCLIQYHHPSCGVEMFPTQLVNMFQHPVSAGVPLFLAVALLAPRLVPTRPADPEDGVEGGPPTPAPPPAVARRAPALLLALLVVVFAGLAIAQFVYYALAALAVGAALPLWLVRARRAGVAPRLVARAGGGALLALGLGLLLARLEGGMLAPSTILGGSQIVLRSVFGYPDGRAGALAILRTHLVNLGVGFALIPLFAAAVVRDRRPVLPFLLAFALGGILVANLWFYARSWDIVKFPSAASFALSLLYVLVVDRWLADRAWGPRGQGPGGPRGQGPGGPRGQGPGGPRGQGPGGPRGQGRPAPWVWLRRAGALLVLGTGLLAAWYLVFPLAPEIRPYEPGARRVDPQVGRTIEWWRTHGYANELIYAQQNIAEELAIFGGLSVVGEDYDLTTMGIADAVLEERQALAAAVRGTMSLEALHGLGVTWIMLSDQEIENLGPRAQAVLADPAGPLVLTATIPAAPPSPRRRIWRVPGEVSSPRQDRLTPRR